MTEASANGCMYIFSGAEYICKVSCYRDLATILTREREKLSYAHGGRNKRGGNGLHERAV